MTPDERKAAAEYAMTWNHPRAGGARRLAHDVLVLVAEVERLTRERDDYKLAASAEAQLADEMRGWALGLRSEVERLTRERDDARHAEKSWKASYLAARDLAEALASAGGDTAEALSHEAPKATHPHRTTEEETCATPTTEASGSEDTPSTRSTALAGVRSVATAVSNTSSSKDTSESPGIAGTSSSDTDAAEDDPEPRCTCEGKSYGGECRTPVCPVHGEAKP